VLKKINQKDVNHLERDINVTQVHHQNLQQGIGVVKGGSQ
jgi:hypothetical protein